MLYVFTGSQAGGLDSRISNRGGHSDRRRGARARLTSRARELRGALLQLPGFARSWRRDRDAFNFRRSRCRLSLGVGPECASVERTRLRVSRSRAAVRGSARPRVSRWRCWPRVWPAKRPERAGGARCLHRAARPSPAPLHYHLRRLTLDPLSLMSNSISR